MNILLCTLREISAGTIYEFPYSRSTLHIYVCMYVCMYVCVYIYIYICISPRLVAWWYKYLIEIDRYHSKGYLIVYVDETWSDLHDTVRKLWSNSSSKCYLEVKELQFVSFCNLVWKCSFAKVTERKKCRKKCRLFGKTLSINMKKVIRLNLWWNTA